jgi:hypothetical protein
MMLCSAALRACPSRPCARGSRKRAHRRVQPRRPGRDRMGGTRRVGTGSGADAPVVARLALAADPAALLACLGQGARSWPGGWREAANVAKDPGFLTVAVSLTRTKLQKRPEPEISGRQLTPLGQSDRASLLEDVAAVEVALLMEVVLDRGVNGGKFLQGPDVPEFRHRTLSSSERLM